MDRDEALRQIEVINQAIESSQKFLMSGTLAIGYGLAILVIPLIESATQRLTFGRDFSLGVVAGLHVIVYLALFHAVKFIVERVWKDDVTQPSHPLLIQAVSFHKPVLVSICGAIFILSYADELRLAGPIVFMMLGSLLNIYGRISSRLVLWLSWSYIVLGIIFGILIVKDNSNLWIWFNSYFGLSFIVMGINLRREKARAWKTEI